MSGKQGRGRGSTTTSDNYLKAIAGLVTVPFEEVEVMARNADDQPTIIAYRSTPGGVIVVTLGITYDANGNLDKVTRT